MRFVRRTRLFCASAGDRAPGLFGAERWEKRKAKKKMQSDAHHVGNECQPWGNYHGSVESQFLEAPHEALEAP